MKTLYSVVFLLALALPGFADVVIWSGSGSFQLANNVSVSTKPRVVIVVSDAATAQTSLVIATTRTKSLAVLGPFNTGFAEVNTPRVKTQYLVSGSGAFTNANNFQFFHMRMKGARSTLALRPANASIANLPKLLTGIYSDILGTPIAATGSFTVRFDSKSTLENNGANRNLQQSVADVVSKFTGAGYAPNGL